MRAAAFFRVFCEAEKYKLIVSLTGDTLAGNRRLFQIVIAAFYDSTLP
jgi:hypothetical protein